MTEVPSLKERQVLRLGAQNPVETMTCRCQHPGFGSILNKRTDRSTGPPDSRIADATAGPSLCAPKIIEAGGARPRAIKAEERGGGEEGGRTGVSWWGAYVKKK